MTLRRRDFLGLSVISLAAGALSGLNSCKSSAADAPGEKLKPITNDVVPISKAEREARIAKTQRLLVANKMDAMVLEPGTTMRYFTDVSWGQSERTMVAIIPARGQISYVCPAFEEARLRERIIIGNKVAVWQEDESPYKVIVNQVKEAGATFGTVGIEESVRFFIADGIKKEAPQWNYPSADAVTIPCRMIKSAAEISLMQKANDITLAAIKYGVSRLKEGTTQRELAATIMTAQNELGGTADFALCLFGEASAHPHGLQQPRALKKGDIVLMDCGCMVEGYNSDITRTIVFGAEPTARQRQIWELEQRAQAAGFAAAKISAPCQAVDAAARKVITDAGFGPDYKLPGLPHRTGHGIGMDGHEWGNMVRGNTQLLEPGMCFSIEPTISIIGEFGVRFEDCVYMTENGPKWFSTPSKSIEEPLG